MKDEPEQLENSIKKCEMDKPYIFISYSQQDSERVYPIVIELQRRGYNIWIDSNGLIGGNGKTWQEGAFPSIANRNCKAVFFMLSSNSLKSAPVFTEIMWSQKGEPVKDHQEENSGITLKIIDIDPEYNLANGKIDTTIRKFISKDDTPLEENDYETMKKVGDSVINSSLYEKGSLSRIRDKGDIASKFNKYLFDIELGGAGSVLIDQYKDENKNIETFTNNIPAECQCIECSTTTAAEPESVEKADPAEAVSVPDTPEPEKGRKEYPNGEIYEGELKDGDPNGQGKLTLKNGTVYDGEFYGSIKNGYGTITYLDGNREVYRTYEGKWVNGQTIEGTMYYPGKDNKFIGTFQNGLLDGENCEARFGIGRAEKVLYKGRFCNGAPQRCTAAHPNGNIYIGDFINWLPSGQFKVKYPNGDVYTGELKDWLPSGQGTMEKIVAGGASVAVYEGNFTNGLLCDDHGSLTYYKLNEDGDRVKQTGLYEGEFKDGKPDGRCKYTPGSENGKSYDGQWANGKKNGHGILSSPDGTVIQEGEWENGKFIG